MPTAPAPLPGTPDPLSPPRVTVGDVESGGSSSPLPLRVNYFFALSRNTSRLLESIRRRVEGWKVPDFIA